MKSQSEWEEDNLPYMMNLLREKAQTCVDVRNTMLESDDGILAEATYNTFWGTGLSSEMTKVTLPQYWPGRNVLGAMQMDLRAELLQDNGDEDHDEDESTEENGDDDNLVSSTPSRSDSHSTGGRHTGTNKSRTKNHKTAQSPLYVQALSKRKPSGSPQTEDGDRKDTKLHKATESGSKTDIT